MGQPFSVLSVTGPYREPKEPAFSYDYVVQRPTWPTPNAVRVKVSIQDELDYLKTKVLGVSGGSPGQQLKITQILVRRIADRKLHIANEAGMFDERNDVIIKPFVGSLSPHFAPLDAWMQASKDTLREEIRATVGI